MAGLAPNRCLGICRYFCSLGAGEEQAAAVKQLNLHLVQNPTAVDLGCMKNGVSQRNRWASCSPKGTPTAAAAENAVITMPMPAARRSAGTTSPMMDITIEIDIPPNIPLKALAVSSAVALCDNAQAIVPAMNPAYAKSSNFRRS